MKPARSKLPGQDFFDERRFGNSLVLALSLHMMLIFGVSFDFERARSGASQLEISVSSHSSEVAPDEADFLAETDQLGSGSLEQKQDLRSDSSTPFDDATDDHAAELMIQQLIQDPTRRRVLTAATGDHSVSSDNPLDQVDAPLAMGADPMTVLNAQIASLEARLDRQRQLLARGPRVRRLTSLSTRRAEDARYLRQWRDHVEAVGNRHYPTEAVAAAIEGNLRLLLALKPDGSIHEARILKSSGQPILDRAALRIVHLAAPYQSFPANLKEEVDILEIIRTWRFEHARLSSH